ncbi:HTH-type transcriptional activator IlvY [Motiliproteus sp.]|uniref:HTH-type transcriptional activator IlvY n=1 Tax=Motiliproteus sp. TaxID=1898955 RepID=UPI003BAC862C
MDHRLLSQFLALAETLHFGRASELSHISPSTLSRSIKQLEENLGTELFLRDNRSVSLTPAGVKFQNYARETLNAWELLQSQLAETQGELQGEISMYCSVTASYSFLYDLLSSFRQAHPKIEIKLHTGDPESAIGRVLAGTEEITIAAKPESLPAGLAFKHIATSPLVFIAPTQEVQSDLPIGPDGVSDWAKTPMILSESGLARKRINRWFKRKGIKPTIYAQVAGHEAIVSMVSLGFGVGVVPRIVLDNSPLAQRVRILEARPALDAYEVGLFTLEKKLKNPLIQAFWHSIH